MSIPFSTTTYLGQLHVPGAETFQVPGPSVREAIDSADNIVTRRRTDLEVALGTEDEPTIVLCKARLEDAKDLLARLHAATNAMQSGQAVHAATVQRVQAAWAVRAGGSPAGENALAHEQEVVIASSAERYARRALQQLFNAVTSTANQIAKQDEVSKARDAAMTRTELICTRLLDEDRHREALSLADEQGRSATPGEMAWYRLAEAIKRKPFIETMSERRRIARTRARQLEHDPRVEDLDALFDARRSAYAGARASAKAKAEATLAELAATS